MGDQLEVGTLSCQTSVCICSIRFFQPPLPAPLSALFTDSFPEGTILAYRVPHVAQYQGRCPL